jgi:predicted dehydrogenase
VFAYTDTLAHQRIEVEDVAVAIVRFDSGALGVLHATTAAYPGMSARCGCRCRVTGDRLSSTMTSSSSSTPRYKAPTRRRADGYNAGHFRVHGRSTASRNPGQLSDAHRPQ